VAQSIRQLCRADHGDDPDVVGRWLADKTEAAFAARIAGPGRMLVAEAAGRIVGVGETEFPGAPPHASPGAPPDASPDSPEHTGKITLNYVAPGWQGRGISRALLAAMEAALVRDGARRAVLTATATARAFYLRHGWQIAAPPRQGRWIVGHPLCKSLAG
jgi:GNAT superfamily N-acetyltransferase